MKVNTSRVFLVIWTCCQKNSQDANHDDLWNRMISCHMTFVECLYRVLSAQLKAWCHVFCVKKELYVFLELQKVFVFAYILTFVSRACFFIYNRRSHFTAKEQPHIDEKDDQNFSDRNDGKLE